MRVVEMSERDRPAWDEYVHQASHAVPQHLSGWQAVMRRSYGYSTCYLMAVDAGRIEGVLPLFQVRSWLTGHALHSLPGGVCTENPEAAQALILQAQYLTGKLGADRLIIRDGRQRWHGDFVTAEHHASRVIALRDTIDESWNSLDTDIRRQIRIARKNGLDTKVSRNPRALEPFYQIWSTCVQRMGTPVFGRSFLQHIVEAFSNQFNIVCVYKGDCVVGAFFSLEMGDTIYSVWGAAMPEHRDLRPTHLAYWHKMQFGVENGFRRLDMGRSPLHSGHYHFKRAWGGEAVPIYQQVHFVKKTSVKTPDAAQRLQIDPQYRAFARLWRRLPLSVARLIGPRLRRHMPFA